MKEHKGGNATRKRTKKPVSADRRMQNRVAQKAYHDRKRERLRELEQKIASMEGVTPTEAQGPPSAVPRYPSSETTPLSLESNSATDLVLNGPAQPHLIDDKPSEEVERNNINAWLEPSLIDISLEVDVGEVEPLTLQTAEAIDTCLGMFDDIAIGNTLGNTMSSYRSLPPSTRFHLRQLAKDGNFDFVDAVLSVLKPTTGDISTTQRAAISSEMASVLEPMTYSPYNNVLRIARFSYLAALFANLSSLGFDFSIFLDETSISPFCGRKRGNNDDPDAPFHLRPLPSQFTVSHHPCIDSLPFPTFRRGVLAALAADPPLLDEDDLCIDLLC